MSSLYIVNVLTWTLFRAVHSAVVVPSFCSASTSYCLKKRRQDDKTGLEEEEEANIHPYMMTKPI